VPMTDEERAGALEGEAADYGEAKARAGFWSRDVALDRAREEIASLVGPDPAKRGHAFFFGLDAAGRRVGWAWTGPVPGAGANRNKRWLFQIIVDEPLRGHGYGRGLLTAVERRLAGEGVGELRLNVFRWNTVAIALYASAGYDVVEDAPRNLEMRKALTRP
jgi:GNAT superfamily N-acetyltransferase